MSWWSEEVAGEGEGVCPPCPRPRSHYTRRLARGHRYAHDSRGFALLTLKGQQWVGATETMRAPVGRGVGGGKEAGEMLGDACVEGRRHGGETGLETYPFGHADQHTKACLPNAASLSGRVEGVAPCRATVVGPEAVPLAPPRQGPSGVGEPELSALARGASSFGLASASPHFLTQLPRLELRNAGAPLKRTRPRLERPRADALPSHARSIRVRHTSHIRKTRIGGGIGLQRHSWASPTSYDHSSWLYPRS